VKICAATRPRMLFVFALLAVYCSTDGAQSQGRTPSIVVQNYYYARPGKAEEVYQWRLHASDVRAKLGLARGRVLRRAPGEKAGDDSHEGGPHDVPDVIWECDYPNPEARAADIARLDNSKEFDAVEKHMDSLIRGFRRVIFEVDPLDAGR
jgi:hypothetical protein